MSCKTPKSTGKVDRKVIREAQKELGITKKITLSDFRKAWISVKGKPQTKQEENFLYGQGLKDFYEDYMTDKDSRNVYQYLKEI